MMLHLGVIDIPYSDASYAQGKGSRRIGQARRGKANAPHNNAPGTQTTGDVAAILEDRYHIQESFYELHQADIAAALESSIQGALENRLLGGPGSIENAAEAESAIETMFKQFLSNREMDAIGVPGVPTLAAMRGVSHRFLHPYARRGERPSFIDTGLMQANFKAWVD